MGDFFEGWKRKIGLFTATMTLAVIGGWIKSDIYPDEFIFRDERSIHIMMSARDHLYWVRCMSIPDSGPPFPARQSGWSTPFHSRKFRPPLFLRDAQIEWQWLWCGFHFAAGSIQDPEQDEETNNILISLWKLPFWSIVIPLTVISLWLLLTKSRKSIPKKSTDPTPDKAM